MSETAPRDLSSVIDYGALPPLPDLDFDTGGAGHAVGHDALALARLAPLEADWRVLELGTGQGVVALHLAARGTVDVTGVELFADPLDAARRHSRRNAKRLVGNVHWIRGDLRERPWRRGAFDLVVMNPPYYPQGNGRVPPDPARAAARHELHGTLRDWTQAASDAAQPGGWVAAIVPVERSDECAGLLGECGMRVTRRTGVRLRGNTERIVVVAQG